MDSSSGLRGGVQAGTLIQHVPAQLRPCPENPTLLLVFVLMLALALVSLLVVSISVADFLVLVLMVVLVLVVRVALKTVRTGLRVRIP